MKKVIAVLLSLILMSSILLTGCSENPKNETGASVSAAEEGKLKLGVVIWSTSDSLGKAMHRLITDTVEAFDGEVIFNTDGTSPESQITCVENLIAAGCNAITIVNYSDSILVKIAEVCEENQVYWSQFCRTIRDPDVKEVVEASPYYVGRIYEDEVNLGYMCGKVLAEKGYKDIAVVTSVAGDTTYDLRDEGFNKACAEFGLNRIAEVRAKSDAAAIAKGVENIIISFPELDAIFQPSTPNNYLESTINVLEKYDKIGDVQIACTGFVTGAMDYIDKDAFAVVVEGFSLDPLFSVVLLANAVQGTPLSDGPIEICYPCMTLVTKEDFDGYYTYVEGEKYPFTHDELRQMSKLINPDFTLEQFQEIINNISVEDVRSRQEQN